MKGIITIIFAYLQVVTALAQSQNAAPPCGGDERICEAPPPPEGNDAAWQNRKKHFRKGDFEKKRFQRLWQRCDANKDGVVDFEEFTKLPRINWLPEARQRKIFERLDADKNSKISKEELEKLCRKIHPGPPFPKLLELDANKDGKISVEEFCSSPFMQRLPEEKRKDIFAKLDTDKDGFITRQDKPPLPPFPPHHKRRHNFDRGAPPEHGGPDKDAPPEQGQADKDAPPEHGGPDKDVSHQEDAPPPSPDDLPPPPDDEKTD